MSALKTNKIQIIKYSPPPPELPILGEINPEEVSFIGRTNYVAALEEKKYVFGIKRSDRRRHLYLIGKSGVGKTKIQELMIRQDIAYGYGVCVIDQPGDLINDLIDFIPEERIKDVCIIDPNDSNYPVAFNPLANVAPELKNQLAENLTEVFKKHFVGNWNPRLEHLVRFTILALLDNPNGTMYGMISMLTDEDYRNESIHHIEDEMVKRFWMNEFSEWSTKFENDAIVPLVNKLIRLLADPMLKNIFNQPENKIDFKEIIDSKKIVLINLAKDKVGEENSSFLGEILLIKIKEAGKNRDKNNQNDFYVYIDEFQNLVTDSFENTLSDARKCGINLTLSHQYVNQIPPKIHQAVMGNVGSIITFRIGGEDALKIKPEYAPIFDVKDMINLGVGEFYIKMTIDGESYDPFSADTLKVLSPTHESFKQNIIEESRLKYSTRLK